MRVVARIPSESAPKSTFPLLQYSIPDKRLEQTSRLDDDDELKSDLSQQRLKGKNAKEKRLVVNGQYFSLAVEGGRRELKAAETLIVGGGGSHKGPRAKHHVLCGPGDQ